MAVLPRSARGRQPEERLQRILRTTLKAGCLKFGVPQLDEATEEYLCGIASAIAAESSNASEIEAKLREQLSPLLLPLPCAEDQVFALCKVLSQATVPAKAEAGDLNAAEAPTDETVLCRCNDLILMYMGSNRRLLDNTRFELLRGHRYGIIGSNGSGKTTLMERIAAGAVSELPAHLRLVHVRHEDLLQHYNPKQTATNVVAACLPAGGNLNDTAAALQAVGFSEVLRERPIRELSGGWRVRLLLAAAVVRKADVLLLDEPTNHLDAEAIAWLVSYLLSLNATCVIVSHDANFLDSVCTDTVHFDECQLKYYVGNFSDYRRQVALQNEEDIKPLLVVRAAEPTLTTRTPVTQEAAVSNVRMNFPVPGKVEGLRSQKKPLLELTDVHFKFREASSYVLQKVNCKVRLNSRIAVVGPNGAGKSTLLSLLCGELLPVQGLGQQIPGEVVRHTGVRLAYVAQSHDFHLAECVKCTAVDYLHIRYKNGYDEEVQKRLTQPGNLEEDAELSRLAKRFGKYAKRVEAVLQRVKRGKEWRYEVKWDGLCEKQNTFEPLSRLRQLGVQGMVAALEERLAAQAAGEERRPLMEREILRHLAAFGLPEEVCKRDIATLSAGQKSKLLLAAAVWNRPHVVCLDEPTNFLDLETTAALGKALHLFRGGVVVASHSEDFLSPLCNEVWRIADGAIVVEEAMNKTATATDGVGANTVADSQ